MNDEAYDQQLHEMRKYLARTMKKKGSSIKDIAEELGVTQKHVRELLKEKR